MAYKFQIPQINPLKFYHQADIINTPAFTQATYGTFNPNLNTRSMDADFFQRNIRSWADKVRYWQPFQQGDYLCLTWLGENSGATGPYHVRFIDCDGKTVKSVAGTKHGTPLPSGDYIWYCKIPLWEIQEGRYFIQLLYSGFLTAKDFFVVSEPIEIKETHPETLLFKYRNSYNDQGVFYEISAIEFYYRVNAALTDLSTGSKFEVYEDQPLNLQLLSGVPYREWTLGIGVANKPVPDYQIDKMERILLSDTLWIDSRQYTRTDGSKLEVERVEKHPLVTATIAIREKENDQTTIVNALYPISFGTVPDSGAFYVHTLDSSAPGSTNIRRWFNSPKQFVAYLNTVFFATYYNPTNYFSVTDANEIFMTTDDSVLHAVYAALTWSFTTYPYYLEMDIEATAGVVDLIISTTSSPSSVSYAFFDTTMDDVPTLGSGTTFSLTKTYTAGTKDTARFFFTSPCTNLDISGSDALIKALGGLLSPAFESLGAGDNAIRRVKNNIFKTVTGSSILGVDLSGNNLSHGNVNSLIQWAGESLPAFDLGGNSLELNDQTPAAPPTISDPGLAAQLSAAVAAGVGIITD